MPRRNSPAQLTLKAATGFALALGSLALHATASAETNLSVEATSGYTNNVLRQPDGGRGEVPASLGLTGTWIDTSGRLLADVEGQVAGIAYLKDSYGDEVLGQLDASVTWWAAPERFAWVLDNVYGQVANDPFLPISPENRQDTNFLSTGPDWYIPLGERTRAYLGGRYGLAWYEVTDDDSGRLLGIAGIDRAVTTSSRLGLQASIETVDFESDLQTDFDRNEAYFRYEFSRGQEPELTVNAGYTWLTSDAGDRSAPLLELQFYKDLSGSVSLWLELASRFSDAGAEFAAGGLPGSGIGSDPGVIPEAGEFEERSGLVAMNYRRSRTIVSLATGVADQIYDTATLDRRRYDLQLTAERRMTQRMTGSIDVRWSRSEYQSNELDQEDTDTQYQLELRRELGERTSLAVVGFYATRSSDNLESEYDETRGYLVFEYSLR